jgi:hypothetical protein
MNTLLHLPPKVPICEMSGSETSPMILQPIKNEALKKAETENSILDEAEMARLKRLAAERQEKKSTDYARNFMMRELYCPIRRAILEEKHEFILEYEFPLHAPVRNLSEVLKLAEEKMPAVNFELEITRRWSWLSFGYVGLFRITAQW